ncbi:MAG: translation elongation factor Ts [Chthoniobacteraceae bacterium]
MTTVNIDAKQVAILREKTGAGMLDCRKALIEANGDIEAAVDILRAKGAASAAKKAGRAANEGVIAQAILAGARTGALVEVNCETDFVAKNESFLALTAGWAKTLAENPSTDLEPARIEAVTKIGENIQIRRHARIDVTGNGLVAAYIHLGGKIGVLLEVGAGKEATVNHDDFKQLVRDITLHIAAANPVSLKREEIPAALLQRERAIYAEQTPKDKPAPVIEKIIEGKMAKFYAGICLLEQPFVKNPEQTITQLVAEKAKALGDTIEVRGFIRYQVGEEIAG